MTVFKAYLKIFLRNIALVALYVGIMILMITLSYSNTPAEDSYVEEKIDVAVIDRDDSDFSHDFRDYMAEHENLLEVEDERHAIQDFIFDDYLRVVIIVPEGFEEAALRGEAKVEQKYSIAGIGELSELYAANYLKNLNALARGGISRDEILEQLKKRDEVDTEVSVVNQVETESAMDGLEVYVNFSAYPIMASTILVVGTVACVFNAEMIRKRNAISAMPMAKMNIQLALGNVLFCLGFVAILWVVAGIMMPEAAFGPAAGMMLFSMVCLALTFGALAMLITTFVSKREVLSGIQTVIPLGLSFISGVFFPVTMLTDGIVVISKVFPTYWYCQLIERIADYTEYGTEQWRDVLMANLVILAFGIGYYVLSLIAKRLLRRSA
jgi:ABC-2 type transport system permease protein